MKRKREPDAKVDTWGEQKALTDLRAELTGAARGTKSSIARVLAILKARGELVDDRLGGKHEMQHLISAATKHANAKTPYGTVVQRLKLSDNYTLEYVHPCAYFYYLSTISTDFSIFIDKILDQLGAQPLSVVVYGDEMTPGNPLRPDPGREAWQWSFSMLEFPNHVLHSHSGWVHITTLRTGVLQTIVGGVPLLAKSILSILFVNKTNLKDGFMIKRPNGSLRHIAAKFVGFLADEKGLKEFYCIKGAGGFKCCPSCLNVTNKVRLPDDYRAVGVDCPNPERFKRCTDRLFFGMLNRLQTTRTTGTLRELFKEEIDFGIKYSRHSMFLDDQLKPMLSPMNNYFRDPQHTLFSSGVAESEVAGVVVRLRRHRKTIDDFKNYATDFTLPKKGGQVDPRWFRQNMFSDIGTKHFAGDLITIVLLMGAFFRRYD